MKKTRISDDNYFQVSGWMLNRLHLKGVELEVFAIIYGFSQDGETEFTGSIQYLCDFTGTSRPTIIKTLKRLADVKLIIKNEIEINSVKFNRYKANLSLIKNFYTGSKETLPGGSKETLHNNKYYNNKELNNNIKYIIEHLNKKTGSEYRPTAKKTGQLLKSLLTGDNPYTVNDCICVIDKQCEKWKGTEWEQYLRPSTLFGAKFEEYLNSKSFARKEQKKPETIWSQTRPEDEISLDDLF